MDGPLGVAFAPTADNAMDAEHRGDLDGLPAAIKILSLRLPRFVGARSPSPLIHSPGAQGQDPYLSAVMNSLMQTLSPAGSPQTGAAGPIADPRVEFELRDPTRQTFTPGPVTPPPGPSGPFLPDQDRGQEGRAGDVRRAPFRWPMGGGDNRPW